MEFRILGPLEVVSDGRALDLGGHKPRALLTLLLLEPNRVVPLDRLIDALWEDEPPETARKALQVYVAQLRKLLGRERLQTQAPGYRLRVEADELDLSRFQRLREEGRFSDALSLWRGPALGEFAYERFAQAEISRLDELRLTCVEERIEAGLASGRHAELVGELEALVEEQPHRERLRMQLMLALYRSGRQAEALGVYQSARASLVDELGIEPGRPLRELHQAVLSQDPALDLPAVEEAEPAADVPTPSVVRDVRKTITALAVLLETSSSLDPETLRRIQGRAFAAVERAVERHGGTVQRSAGDVLSALFGVPLVHEDDAQRAVRAAADAHAALSALVVDVAGESGIELEFRVGVSTGEVIAGGDGTTGEPLTLSTRLARNAPAGDVELDERTRRLVQRPVRRLVSPMIGRERERRRLDDAYEQTVGDRSCQLFTVLGPAGVGKSRLVEEFVRDLAGRALVARGRCLPYGEGITFWPLMQAVREALGSDDGDINAKLVTALASEPDGGQTAQQAAELLGLAESGGAAEDGFRAVRSVLRGLARSQPLVLVFDDIHWGEPTFLDLVEDVAASARDAPILVLCLARPELLDVRPTWAGGKPNATSVLLEPLSDHECEQLIESLVGGAEAAAHLGARIVEAAEGNPLFVEEMLSMLIDDGLLVREGGHWAAAGDVADVRVPPTIQALLAARLDRLEADERAVIERAAVEGKVFHEGAVARLAPASLAARVGQHLDALVRKELIRPGGSDLAGERAFRFRHLLIRDAAYDAIPKANRVELHESFARWLDERAEEKVAGYEEIVGYHLEQAYRCRTEVGPVDDAARAVGRLAAERLGSAAHRAFMRGDAAAAVNLIARAVPLLPADDPSRIDLVPNVRVVQGLSGDLGWAERVLDEAAATAAATGDPRLEAHALVQRAFLHLFTRPDVTPRELSSVAESAILVFEEHGDQLGLARAWRLVAQAHYLGRGGGPSAEASARALEHGRRAGDQLELREIIEWLCVALMLGPARPEEMSARCTDLLSDVERDGRLAPTVLSVLANAEAMQGHEEEAAELLDRWRTAVEELGDPIWLAGINFGFVALAADPEAAERELRPGYDALKRMGEKSHFSSVAGLLARAVCAQGRYEEADRLSRESERTARANDIHSHILWRTTRAKVLAHAGEVEAGERVAREAVEFAAGSDFLDSHGDALMDMAEVLLLADRRDEAAAALLRAVELYTQKGNVVSAARARAQVVKLPAS